MVRGMYISATGMQLQRRNMEVVTNNMVNAETTGFKKDFVASRAFDDVLIERLYDNDPAIINTSRYVGPLSFGTRVDQLYIDFSSGNFESTEVPTDLAIAGEGFFAVSTPAGERFTRNSSYTVNAIGYLTDGDGNYLLGQNGRIYTGVNNFAVDSVGNVTVDGQYVDRIRVVSFNDYQGLRKQGDNLYYHMGEAPIEAAGYEIKQGFLEGSNVDIAREMVDMITIYRTYETNQRMLTMIDETVGKAVNEIGRLG